MDQKRLIKQIIEFNQATFNNIFNGIVLLQDQFERAASTALDQTIGLPAENRKAIENWAEVFKDGRNSFKLQIDNGFEQAHKLLAI